MNRLATGTVLLALVAVVAGCAALKSDPVVGKWEVWNQNYNVGRGPQSGANSGAGWVKSETVEFKRGGALDWPGRDFTVNGVQITTYRWVKSKTDDVYSILAMWKKESGLVMERYKLSEGKLVEVDEKGQPLQPLSSVLVRPGTNQKTSGNPS